MKVRGCGRSRRWVDRRDDLGAGGLGEPLEFGERLLERPDLVAAVDADEDRAVAAILAVLFGFGVVALSHVERCLL